MQYSKNALPHLAKYQGPLGRNFRGGIIYPGTETIKLICKTAGEQHVSVGFTGLVDIEMRQPDHYINLGRIASALPEEL